MEDEVMQFQTIILMLNENRKSKRRNDTRMARKICKYIQRAI
ncbi:MAG TPA: hypothetical protein OIM28_04175 [Clostridiaceae bacterium]|nr:hypothetical protein [Clostridiaceae bacterium]